MKTLPAFATCLLFVLGLFFSITAQVHAANPPYSPQDISSYTYEDDGGTKCGDANGQAADRSKIGDNAKLDANGFPDDEQGGSNYFYQQPDHYCWYYDEHYICGPDGCDSAAEQGWKHFPNQYVAEQGTGSCQGLQNCDILQNTQYRLLPPGATLSAKPTTVASGGSSTLTYECDHSGSGSIDNGIGAITADGAQHTKTASNITTTTTYKLTCNGYGTNGGPAYATAKVTVSAISQPDLISGSISASPSPVVNDVSETLTGVVTNSGNATTGKGFNDLFEFYKGANPPVNFSDIQDMKTVTHASALAAGAKYTDSTTYSFSSDGTWWVRLCANTDTNGNTPGTGYAGTAEIDYTNNCGPANGYSGWTEVDVKAPDLISGAPYVYAPVFTNEPTDLNSLITNQGGAATGCHGPDVNGDGQPDYCFANFFEVDDDTDHNAWRVGGTDYFVNAGLAINGSRVSSVSYAFPHSGTWYVQACADAIDGKGGGNYIDEDGHEGNNCSGWVPITVNDAAIDLVSYGLTLSPNPTYVGVKTDISATVKNNGSEDTGCPGDDGNGNPYCFTNLFQIGQDDGSGNITNIQDIGTNSFSAQLTAGATRTATLKNYVFANGGTYYVRACADKASQNDQYGDVQEGSNHEYEDNNCTDDSDGIDGWTQVVVTQAQTYCGCTATDDNGNVSCTATNSGFADPDSSLDFNWTADGGVPSGQENINLNPWSTKFTDTNNHEIDIIVTDPNNGQSAAGSCIAKGKINQCGSAGGSISANPTRVKKGTSTLLSTTGVHAAASTDSCTVTGSPGGFNQPLGSPDQDCAVPDWSGQSNGLTGQTIFTLACTNNPNVDSVTVDIVPGIQEF